MNSLQTSIADPATASKLAAKAPILDVHDVTVAYHRKPVLWDVDLTLTEPCLLASSVPTGREKAR